LLSQKDDERRSVHALRPTATKASLDGSNRQGSINDGVPGHLSPAARIYLSDTEDHAEGLLESLDLFAARATGLVDLVFNELAFLANRNMEVLTLSYVLTHAALSAWPSLTSDPPPHPLPAWPARCSSCP
jgi:Mg2+ and Co2+ transporter CorA